MPWARYDDELPMNKKIARLRAQGVNGIAALGLHVLCNTWSRNQGTGGHIEPHIPEQLVGKPGLKLARILAEATMFDPHENGWMIHDFDEYSDPNDPDPHRSAADRRREVSEKRAAAGRQGGLAKAKQSSSKTEALLQQTSSPDPVPVPDPLLHESSSSSQVGSDPASDDDWFFKILLARIATTRSERASTNPTGYQAAVLANLARERPAIQAMLDALPHMRTDPNLAADWYEQSTWKLRGTA